MQAVTGFFARIALFVALVLLPVAATAQPAQIQAPAAQPAPVAKPADPKALQIGSVIQLNSGGPTLTIVGISEGSVRAQWYNTSTHVFVMADFPQAAVKIAADDDDEDDEDEDED